MTLDIKQEAESFFKRYGTTPQSFGKYQFDDLVKFAQRCVDKATAWQPIADAPKDGTRVFVHPPIWPERKASIAKWNTDKYAKYPKPYWEREDALGKVGISRERPPTHFCFINLPQPPEAA